MIISHSNEVLEAAKIINYELVLLPVEKSKKVLQIVLEKFCHKEKYSFPLWEDIVDRDSIRYKFAWELFNQIFDKESVVLFFDHDDDENMFLFDDGGVLTKIFENCYKFVFYITNLNNDFLIAFNDHDYLIGAGMGKLIVNNIAMGKYNPH
ncbi:hypothetical protein [Pedobacter sp. P26]|uniref:hypothetical protein n=1 Tax=Pedobacter sp. P26 TaxID=3423956 RepID=UPI003D671E02